MAYHDYDWCRENWRDFTALAPEEEMLIKMAKNGTLTAFTLKKIREEFFAIQEKSETKKNKTVIKRKRKLKPIMVKETGQVFKCVNDIALFFNVSRQNVYTALNLNTRLKRKWTLEEIA